MTHQRRGHAVAAPASSGGVRWDRDARGLIAAETYTQGATKTRRDYDYDGRGALTRVTTGGEVAGYSYTSSGLPDTVSDALGARSVHRAGNTLVVGDTTYTWDNAGRVVGKGDWTFDYGPSGQLSHAGRAGRQIDFVYDDADQRLLKRVDGAPVGAEVAGGVLTDGHFVELVVVGGVVAGVLDNGQFTALLTDPRGTPFAGSDGAPGLASPYGARVSHLRDAETIDYARLGWDPDLDVIRMGVRDYDAKLGQFLTPDPLYFEDLEKCQSSPVQCALYGYAGGNPLNFVDPTGMGFWSVVRELAADTVDLAAMAVGGVVGASGGALLSAPTGPGVVVGASLGAVGGAGLARGLISPVSDLIRGERTSPGRQLRALVEGAAFEVGGQFAVKAAGVVAPMVRRVASRIIGNGAASTSVPGALAGVTDAEISAAIESPIKSDLMITSPAPTGSRYNVNPAMMMNEHTVQSTTSAVGASGNVATKIRVHTADPTAPVGSNSATGNTVSITQGGGTRRFIPGQGWVQTSTATPAEMNASHVPIHR